LAVTGLGLVVTSGCLLKDRTDTWYLDAGGAVTWSIVEKDVLSDANAAADRAAEETTYISGVRTGTHSLAKAFRQLGQIDVKTRLLRGESPYTVVTDARFPSLETLGFRLITRLRLAGTSVVNRHTDATEWVFTIRDPHAEDGADANDDDMKDLLSGMEGLKVVLVAGRFFEADRFNLSRDGRVATLKVEEDANTKFDEGAPLVFRLKWR
jgi:hypothetical protein